MLLCPVGPEELSDHLSRKESRKRPGSSELNMAHIRIKIGISKSPFRMINH